MQCVKSVLQVTVLLSKYCHDSEIRKIATPWGLNVCLG